MHGAADCCHTDLKQTRPIFAPTHLSGFRLSKVDSLPVMKFQLQNPSLDALYPTSQRPRKHKDPAKEDFWIPPNILGLRTRMSHPCIYMVFWAPTAKPNNRHHKRNQAEPISLQRNRDAPPGLLFRNFLSATILQKPCYQLCILTLLWLFKLCSFTQKPSFWAGVGSSEVLA